MLTEEERIQMLVKPAHEVDVVLDTDTYNEIDDQYALSYLIASEDRLKLKAIYAAPFHNEKSDGPKDGMEKSYAEIFNILTLLGREDLKEHVFKGSGSYLTSETVPTVSAAASDLAARAMNYTSKHPLYVIAIGAITNIASAILLNPEICGRMVVIWLGGNAHHWPDNKEFNIYQDVAAARVVFDSGVPLVQLPCMGVVSSLTVSEPELEYHLRGKNALCDYLVDITEREGHLHGCSTWTRIIWDVSAVGWLLGKNFMADCLVHTPVPEYDHRYAFDQRRHLMKYVYFIYRDALIQDLFEKLSKF